MVAARVVLDWNINSEIGTPEEAAARHGLKAKTLGDAGNGFAEVSFMGNALNVYELAIEYCCGDPVEAAWHISDSEGRWENWVRSGSSIAQRKQTLEIQAKALGESMIEEILLPGDLVVPAPELRHNGERWALVWSTSILEATGNYVPPVVLDHNDVSIVISVRQNRSNRRTVEAYVVTSGGVAGYVMGHDIVKVGT